MENSRRQSETTNAEGSTSDVEEMPEQSPSNNNKPGTQFDLLKRLRKTAKQPSSRKPYKHNYQAEWFEQYGIAEIGSKIVCVLCNWTVSDPMMRPAKFKEHLASHHAAVLRMTEDKRVVEFKSAFEKLKSQGRLIDRMVSLTEKLTVTSLKLAYIIAKQKRPHTEGETVVSECADAIASTLFDDMPEVKRRIDMLSTSNDTIRRRTQLLSTDLREQLVADLKGTEYWAMAIDESTDITDVPQLSIFVRFSANQHFKEDLLGLVALRTTTKGADIFLAVTSLCEQLGLSMTNLVQVATDGAPAMIGNANGLVALLQKKYPMVTGTHCIIHRQALVSKVLPVDLAHTLDCVIDAVNYIRAHALNRRLFMELCNDNEETYTELVLHTGVRWLSKGNVLRRVFALRNSVVTFLEEQKSTLQQDFVSTQFHGKVAFLADIFSRLNQMNLKLQGRDKFIFHMLEVVQAELGILRLLRRQMAANDVRNFATLTDWMTEVVQEEWLTIKAVCLELIDSLITEFESRFTENLDKFDAVRFPFRADPERLPGRSALQLIALQADHDEKERFSTVSLAEFWLRLDSESYEDIQATALKTLTKFGSTYLCEFSFSTMNLIKTKCRSSLTNESLANDLQVALSTYKPQYAKFAANMQHHPSH